MNDFRLPPFPKGSRVGLLGGSFDPAHDGHRHITLQALHRFNLDYILWMVSPGNPHKTAQPAPLADRLSHARRVMQHPRVLVTDLERHLETVYTVDTIRALRHRYAGLRFIWLMGADNLADFHLWSGWEEIMQTVPIGVLARPGDRLRARRSPATLRYERARLPAARSGLLSTRQAPCWCCINIPMRATSSTEIRARGEWRH